MNEALRDWVANVEDTFYIIGSAAGPHPYPAMVRDFQSIIGRETREQMMAREGRLPDSLVACIGGGSNAMGLFHPFLDDRQVRIIGVEAGGHGVAQLPPGRRPGGPLAGRGPGGACRVPRAHVSLRRLRSPAVALAAPARRGERRGNRSRALAERLRRRRLTPPRPPPGWAPARGRARSARGRFGPRLRVSSDTSRAISQVT